MYFGYGTVENHQEQQQITSLPFLLGDRTVKKKKKNTAIKAILKSENIYNIIFLFYDKLAINSNIRLLVISLDFHFFLDIVINNFYFFLEINSKNEQ